MAERAFCVNLTLVGVTHIQPLINSRILIYTDSYGQTPAHEKDTA